MNSGEIEIDSIEEHLPPITQQKPSYRIDVSTRERTPDYAVQNFDGTFDTVHAHDVQTRVCSRPLFNFIMVSALVLSALITCLVLLAVRGFEAPGSTWLQTMVSFCLGVFLPSPRIKKNLS